MEQREAYYRYIDPVGFFSRLSSLPESSIHFLRITCPKVRKVHFFQLSMGSLLFSICHCFGPVYFNFKQHQVSPAVYLPDWLVAVFLDHLPFDACARIWDIVVLEGDSFLFRVAIGILAVLSGRLYFPDRKELLEVLRCAFVISREAAL